MIYPRLSDNQAHREVGIPYENIVRIRQGGSPRRLDGAPTETGDKNVFYVDLDFTTHYERVYFDRRHPGKITIKKAEVHKF